jgi:hypothetical protein
MAGEAAGPRVFWVGYLVGPFIELRARAEEEGRLEAFEDELDSRRAACEKAADVLDCQYCISDCWESVPSGMTDVTRSLIVVRVSWPAERQPVLDGEQLLWMGTLTDTPFATVQAVEDIDRDGRPELTVDVETQTDWPAGDGGSAERMRHYLDGDTLAIQLSLLESYEEDGHGGGFVHRTEVTRHDANQDGVDDFHVHFVREVFLRDCESGQDDEDDGEGEMRMAKPRHRRPQSVSPSTSTSTRSIGQLATNGGCRVGSAGRGSEARAGALAFVTPSRAG